VPTTKDLIKPMIIPINRQTKKAANGQISEPHPPTNVNQTTDRRTVAELGTQRNTEARKILD
jgi:hypothetical protein